MGKHKEGGKGCDMGWCWAERWGSNKGRRCDGRSGCEGHLSKGWGWARGLSKRWGWDRAENCDKGWNKDRGGDSGQARARDRSWSGDLDLGFRWDTTTGRDRFGKRGEGVAGGQGWDWDRTRGRDKGWAMARGGGGAGQASAGRSQS